MKSPEQQVIEKAMAEIRKISGDQKKTMERWYFYSDQKDVEQLYLILTDTASENWVSRLPKSLYDIVGALALGALMDLMGRVNKFYQSPPVESN